MLLQVNQPELLKLTPGETIVAAIRDNLVKTNRTWGQLKGNDVAAIIDAMPEAEKPAKEAKTRVGRVKTLVTEDDWLESLRNEPAMAGVDVRKELALAQFWCKGHNRQCTRMFFQNWLLKASQTVASAGGQALPRFAGGQQGGTGPIHSFPEPDGWRDWINANRPDSVYAAGNESCNLAWYQLDFIVKRWIREQMGVR